MSTTDSQQELASFFTKDSGNPGVPQMSKREWIAAMCLQGILANKNATKTTMWSTAQSAVMYADQLIAALELDLETGVPLPQPAAFPGIAIPVVGSRSE